MAPARNANDVFMRWCLRACTLHTSETVQLWRAKRARRSGTRTHKQRSYDIGHCSDIGQSLVTATPPQART